MKKVGVYVRVSTEEQAKVIEGSPKNQLEAGRKHVEGENLKHGNRWGILVDEYVDDGYSAKDLNRPRMKDLLVDISKGRIDTVIVTEWSRLSRKVRHSIDIVEFLKKHDASFIALRQNFDTSTAMGRAMFHFAVEFSQLEREMTIERVKASYQARAGRGLWTGGPVLFGFKPTERKGHIEVDAAKQIIADQIFDIFLHEGGSLRNSVRLINTSGFYRDSGKPWNFQALGHWIRIGENTVSPGKVGPGF